jgi:MFS family permease
MMKHMGSNVGDNAPFYARTFVATLFFAESLTAFWWGSLSDRIKRKPVLLLGNGGTLLSSISMGFSTNIWMALPGRAFGGD